MSKCRSVAQIIGIVMEARGTKSISQQGTVFRFPEVEEDIDEDEDREMTI